MNKVFMKDLYRYGYNGFMGMINSCQHDEVRYIKYFRKAQNTNNKILLILYRIILKRISNKTLIFNRNNRRFM